MSDLDFYCQVSIDTGVVVYTFHRGDTSYGLKQASGLEKDASIMSLNLVHINFSKVNLPNYVRFDEVFGSVAACNIDVVVKILRKYGDLFDKVFIISHREDIKEVLDANCILTIKKKENISIIE
jgi:hypothetical protein